MIALPGLATRRTEIFVMISELANCHAAVFIYKKDDLFKQPQSPSGEFSIVLILKMVHILSTVNNFSMCMRCAVLGSLVRSSLGARGLLGLLVA